MGWFMDLEVWMIFKWRSRMYGRPCLARVGAFTSLVPFKLFNILQFTFSIKSTKVQQQLNY